MESGIVESLNHCKTNAPKMRNLGDNPVRYLLHLTPESRIPLSFTTTS
jgi:hypothetical protein